MIRQILDSAQVSKESCASLLGVSERVFDAWMAERQPIPDGYARPLSAMLGVTPSELHLSASQARRADRTPALWFKLRDARVSSRDRECVALVRRFAYLYDQFEAAVSGRTSVWSSIFDSIRRSTDTQASPSEQGRKAAKAFRVARGLDTGAQGIGEVFRANLRAAGVLVVETPIASSQIEGFSFYVKTGAELGEETERPCVVANTYGTTWFRRNSILLHEVAHAIFDAPSTGAALDFGGDLERTDDVAEVRAQAFAQELLIPSRVLDHVAQAHAIRWDDLTPPDLAVLMAQTHAEQRLVVSAAVDAGHLEADAAAAASTMDVADLLRETSSHAQPALKYLARHPQFADYLDKRTTTTKPIELRLPVGYVGKVIEAVKDASITWGKAAELLMVDRDTFQERFGELVESE